MKNRKVVLVILLIGVLLLTMTGCPISRENFELVDEGPLMDFQVSSSGWRILLGSNLYFIDGRYILLYDNPLYLGEYYYLYKDTIGGITLACPYKLTQEVIKQNELEDNT